MTADLMILDLNEPAFVPFNSAARQIVFAEAGRAVETVLVGGRPVVRDRKLVTVDEAALAAEIGENRAGVSSRRPGAGQPQYGSYRAAPERQPRGVESSAGVRTVHRPRRLLVSHRRHAFCFCRRSEQLNLRDPIMFNPARIR